MTYGIVVGLLSATLAWLEQASALMIVVTYVLSGNLGVLIAMLSTSSSR